MDHDHHNAHPAGLAAPERLLIPETQTPAVGAGAAGDHEIEHRDSASSGAGVALDAISASRQRHERGHPRPPSTAVKTPAGAR
jgi:hypothetical protein